MFHSRFSHDVPMSSITMTVQKSCLYTAIQYNTIDICTICLEQMPRFADGVIVAAMNTHPFNAVPIYSYVSNNEGVCANIVCCSRHTSARRSYVSAYI